MAKLQIYLPDGAQPVHDLSEDKTTLGRLADNSIPIDDASVSSHHAEIVFEHEAWHLHDLDSTNGTFVNGEKVTDVILRHGDEVRFGAIETVFNSEEKDAEQPLPASTSAAAEVAHQSTRPASFVSASPVPKNVIKKDPVGGIMIGLAVLGFLAAGVAVFMVVQMTPPV